MLIVLEGANGTGKSTTATMLRDKLTAAGVSVEIVKYPDYETETGKLVATYLKGTFGKSPESIPMQAALYALDRSYGKGKLHAALNRNRVVILDRYVYSNTAIMGAMSQEHLPMLKEMATMEFNVGHLPRPDYTFLIELDEEHLQKSMCERKEERDIHEDDDLNLRIAKNYRALGEEYKWITIPGVHNGVRRTVDEVATDIIYTIEEQLKRWPTTSL